MRRTRFPWVAAVLGGLLLGLSAFGATRQLYGKPLRGLTPVALGELMDGGERRAGQEVRTSGTVAASPAPGPDRFTIRSGEASLLVVFTDPGVRVPADVGGAEAAVEGVFRTGPTRIEARGAELTQRDGR